RRSIGARRRWGKVIPLPALGLLPGQEAPAPAALAQRSGIDPESTEDLQGYGQRVRIAPEVGIQASENAKHSLGWLHGARVGLFPGLCRARLRLPLHFLPFHHAVGSERLTAPTQLAVDDLDRVVLGFAVGPLADRRFQL